MGTQPHGQARAYPPSMPRSITADVVDSEEERFLLAVDRACASVVTDRLVTIPSVQPREMLPLSFSTTVTAEAPVPAGQPNQRPTTRQALGQRECSVLSLETSPAIDADRMATAGGATADRADEPLGLVDMTLMRTDAAVVPPARIAATAEQAVILLRETVLFQPPVERGALSNLPALTCPAARAVVDGQHVRVCLPAAFAGSAIGMENPQLALPDSVRSGVRSGESVCAACGTPQSTPEPTMGGSQGRAFHTACNLQPCPQPLGPAPSCACTVPHRCTPESSTSWAVRRWSAGMPCRRPRSGDPDSGWLREALGSVAARRYCCSWPSSTSWPTDVTSA